MSVLLLSNRGFHELLSPHIIFIVFCEAYSSPHLVVEEMLQSIINPHTLCIQRVRYVAGCMLACVDVSDYGVFPLRFGLVNDNDTSHLVGEPKSRESGFCFFIATYSC